MSTFDRLIIAEIGSVHDGSFGNACKLIDLAARCGAGAVKFQTHIAAAEMIPGAPPPPYFSGEPRMAYFERTGFDKTQWHALAEHTRDAGLLFLSSPFSLEAVDLLEEIGMAAYKIASGEVSNTPLLEKIAALSKPVLMSSGMSSWAELERAVSIVSPGCETVVMQCASIYPCPPEQVGLNVLGEMTTRFTGLTIGYSDHTQGLAAAFAAAAQGARVIEKHLTFSRAMYGSDAQFATEPREFEILCQGLNEIWTMADTDIDKDAAAAGLSDMKKVFEKCVVAANDISAGTPLTRDHLSFKKPGDGIPAADYDKLLGRRLKAAVATDHQFTWEDFE